jgi:ABC-2 type transport system ATP-binding protein
MKMNAASVSLPVDSIAAGLHSMPLDARGLTKAYAGRRVLNNVSLSIEPGTVLGLIGRNGAGKSTLIRAMLGLIEVDAGSARVFGEPALSLSDRSKEQLGYVPQQPDALAWMGVAQMLDFVGRFYPNWEKSFVETTLKRWQLPRDAVLAKLSPGERQRVDLIRAIAMRPRLLVLDEPAAALDPVARRDLLREIALRANDDGTSVLFSTHIVSDLERVASHIAFLHEGKLLLQAPIDDLKERFARLSLPAVIAKRGALPGEIHRRVNSGGSSALTGTVSAVIERAAGADWPAVVHETGVRLDVLGLEDLFVEIAE